MTLLTKLVSFSKGKSTVHAKASPSPSQTPGIKWAELSQEWLPSHRDMAKPSSGLSRRPLPPHICWWTAQCCGFLLNSNPLTSQGYSEDALWARVTWEGTEANNACPDSYRRGRLAAGTWAAGTALPVVWTQGRLPHRVRPQELWPSSWCFASDSQGLPLKWLKAPSALVYFTSPGITLSAQEGSGRSHFVSLCLLLFKSHILGWPALYLQQSRLCRVKWHLESVYNLTLSGTWLPRDLSMEISNNKPRKELRLRKAFR